jgi:hypothetical protein
MLSFRIEEGQVVEVTSEFTSQKEGKWINRNNLYTFDFAVLIAEQATELTGDLHLAIYRESVLPHCDIIRSPKVGDPVSYAFNGDSYPCGEIVKISRSLKVVTTSTGRKFYRRKESGAWINAGTWTLVHGHVETRNPHF